MSGVVSVESCDALQEEVAALKANTQRQLAELAAFCEVADVTVKTAQREAADVRPCCAARVLCVGLAHQRVCLTRTAVCWVSVHPHTAAQRRPGWRARRRAGERGAGAVCSDQRDCDQGSAG